MSDSKTNRIMPKDLPGEEKGAVHLGTTSRVKSIVGSVYSFYYRSATASKSSQNALILLLHGGAWLSNGRWRRPSRKYFTGVDLRAFSQDEQTTIMTELGGRSNVSLNDVEALDIAFPDRKAYVRTYDLRKIRSLHTIDVSTFLNIDG